ncbi:MAG: UpxY family transcription antiterminator [Escherichia coli]|nr:UpxY family transcription antiterminator [Escherichia coli]
MSEMKVKENKSGGGSTSPCTGFASDALPEVLGLTAENSQTGVSTKNALLKTKIIPHWYVLRATYGQEKKAYDYLVSRKVKAFYPTMRVMKEVKGKRIYVVESRIPNLLFVFGTEEEIKTYVYDNVNLPFLRFYYRYFFVNHKTEKTPMIVPDRQMENLMIICASESDNIVFSSESIKKFEEGKLVRVIEGPFKGVIGRVAKYKKQQRVGITIDSIGTMATAYVPSDFLEFE